MHLVLILLVLALQSATVNPHLGTYRGTARNAAGALQLGNANATTTVFQMDADGDSLYLRAHARGGTTVPVAVWPMTRVTSTPESISAKGLRRGPLHLRRTLQWSLSGGIRVSATITTHGASQQADDFFGGGTVMLTLLKVR